VGSLFYFLSIVFDQKEINTSSFNCFSFIRNQRKKDMTAIDTARGGEKSLPSEF